MTAGQVLTVGGTVLVSAAVNVATGMLTQNWTAAWWACSGVLVALNAALAVWRPREDDRRSQRASDVEAESGEQTMTGSGEQVVERSTFRGSLIQRMDD